MKSLTGHTLPHSFPPGFNILQYLFNLNATNRHAFQYSQNRCTENNYRQLSATENNLHIHETIVGQCLKDGIAAQRVPHMNKVRQVMLNKFS